MLRKEKVTREIDGDTFEAANRKYSAHLANVNAPEKNTRIGLKATRMLRDLIAGETVTVDTVARDKFSRSVDNVASVENRSIEL